MQENAQLPILAVENILPTLKDLPLILADHRRRASLGGEAAQALIVECEASATISFDQDEKLKNMIVKIKGTVQKFKDTRSPITQLMDEVKSALIKEEKSLEVYAGTLQEFRNRRAQEVAAENRRLEEEQRRIAAKNRERAEMVEKFTAGIGTALNKKLFDKKQELTASFNSLTLEDIDQRGQRLRELNFTFPAHKLDEILGHITTTFSIHTSEEAASIYQEVKDAYLFDEFYSRYLDEMLAHRQQLVDRLPAKKQELQEAKRQADERLRLQREKEEQDRKDAELRRQQAEAKNKEEAERLRQQAEQNRLRQEELRLKQEEQRLLAEQQQREREERERKEQERLEIERQEAQAKTEREAEAARSQSNAATLFDQLAAANLKQAEGEVRKGWEIIVEDLRGWAFIFEYWMLNEMPNVYTKDPAKVGKTSLDQMKTYCEKVAGETKIKTPFLTYKETITAVNRKTPAKKNG